MTVSGLAGSVAPASGASVSTVAVTSMTRQVPATWPAAVASMTCWPTTKPSVSQLPVARVRVALRLGAGTLASVAVPLHVTVSTGVTVKDPVLPAAGTVAPVAVSGRRTSVVGDVMSTTCHLPASPDTVTCWPTV